MFPYSCVLWLKDLSVCCYNLRPSSNEGIGRSGDTALHILNLGIRYTRVVSFTLRQV
jgi:hypothetical protein